MLVELIDRDENLIVWTRSFPLALLPDGRIAHLDAMLAGLVRSIINPGGIIAERVLQESPRISLMAGYPCLLHAAEFKMQRSAETYRRVRTCLAETLASKPRLARAWALTAELEQDNVDFNYAGAAKSDSGRALAMANHAVVLGPDDAAARHILTLLQYRAGDYSRAVANGLQSYELNPYSSDLISRVGNILFFIGDSRGLDLTRRALELDPDLAPWFQQSLFFDAVAKGRAADAVAAIGAMSDLRGQGRIYMIALRAIAAAMEGKPATARHYWSIVTHAMPQAATDPQQVFTRMGVSVSYADRGVAILRSAGVFDRS